MSGTFTFNPDFTSKVQFKPDVRVAKFGDGYEQRVQFGINANPAKWSLQFSLRQDTEANAIDAFLQNQGALQSFFWTAPGQTVPVKYVCRTWSKAPVHGQGTATAPAYLWNLAAVFEQVFEP